MHQQNTCDLSAPQVRSDALAPFVEAIPSQDATGSGSEDPARKEREFLQPRNVRSAESLGKSSGDVTPSTPHPATTAEPTQQRGEEEAFVQLQRHSTSEPDVGDP
jgi:hypothetical protein